MVTVTITVHTIIYYVSSDNAAQLHQHKYKADPFPANHCIFTHPLRTAHTTANMQKRLLGHSIESVAAWQVCSMLIMSPSTTRVHDSGVQISESVQFDSP